MTLTLGKAYFFAECYTRQSDQYTPFLFIFSIPSKQTKDITYTSHISHNHHRYHISHKHHKTNKFSQHYQHVLTTCPALGKDNDRQLLTTTDGPLPRAVVCRVFGTWQRFFAECFSVPRALHSVNAVITRQRILCRVPDKKHSAKRQALDKEPDSGSVRGLWGIDIH
jgi:hypothetical protein